MIVERRKAFTGSGSEVIGGEATRANTRENGNALSRENAQVDREAAQEIEIAQNIPIPNTT
jgi:hypothetical protein